MARPVSLGALASLLLSVSLVSGCRATRADPRALGMKDPYAEYFRPALRVYFDSGTDDDGEIDVFEDGAFTAAVDFLGLSFPFLVHSGKARKEGAEKIEESERQLDVLEDTVDDLEIPAARAGTAIVEDQKEAIDRMNERARSTRLDGDWAIGPRFAVGITGPADGEEASGVPVVYFSAQLFADFQRGGEVNDDEGVGMRLEVGWIIGISPDESISNNDDSAVFIGLTTFL